jgi:hypothetical protein
MVASNLRQANRVLVPQVRINPKIFALDIGLSKADSSKNAGEIVELTQDGQVKPHVKNQALSDGLTIDSASRRMFWTCMGSLNNRDGAIYSADLDGSNIETVLAPGAVHTPKQLNPDMTTIRIVQS